MINRLLFVYGSLLDAGNEFAAYLNNNAVLYAKGTLKGKLYDIGEYPGAIADANGYAIHGSILSLHDPIENLKILDDYEGFGEDEEQPNLFIRELLPVDTIMGQVACWVYLYNLSIDRFPEITSGDYLTYLSKKAIT